MTRSLILLSLIFLFQKTQAQPYSPDWKSLDSRPTPEWWLDSKFGIFIHWGVYSVPAWCSKGNYAEWYQYGLMTGDTARAKFHREKFGASFSYYDFADQFKAELYKPDDWVKLFERSGAKYVVLTSKHHDGYCLWPSAEANKTWGFPWHSLDRGPRRDLLGELFTALRKTSVKPGMYFSLYEWFNPLWKSDKKRYAREHVTPQMTELIQKYKPYVFWTDGDWEAPAETWGSQEFIAWTYNQSAMKDSIVLNDRWGSGIRFHHAGIYTPEYQPDMDFEDHSWEESRGMGFSYGYNLEEDAWDYNSTQVLLLHLIDKVSRGGNFLLDIGPDEHGKIPPIMQQRLLEMGEWMKTNGEAIYATRRWRTPSQWSAGRQDFKMKKNPHIADDWKTGGDVLLKLTVDPEPGFAVKECFFTWNPKTNALYAILPKWPADNKLILKDLNLPAGTLVSFLATGETLNFQNEGKNVAVSLPAFDPNRMRSQSAWTVKINNFGAFAPKPKIEEMIDFKTMEQRAKATAAPGLTVRYTLDGSLPEESSPVCEGPILIKKGQEFVARTFGKNVLPSTPIGLKSKTFNLMPAPKLTETPRPGGLQMFEVTPKNYDSQSVESAIQGEIEIVKEIKMAAKCEKEKCAQIFNGYLNIPETGGYRFFTESDDGSLLYLDDQKVVDNDGLHGVERRETTVFLEKGMHHFRLVYFNAGGGSGLKAGLSRVDETGLKAIPADWFFY